MAKRLVRASYDEDSMNLNVQYLSGEENEEGEAVVAAEAGFEFGELPEEIQRKTSLFGLHQLLVQRSNQTGSSIVEKQNAMAEVFANLKEGNWSHRGGGGFGGAIPLAARALAKVKGVSEAVAYETWKSLDKPTKQALKENDKISQAMEEIKAEGSQATKMDLADLL